MAQTAEINKSKKLTRNLFFLIISLVLVNIIAYKVYTQVDLTSDKRFTTTDATKNLLKSIDEPLKITVFLTGNDMPAAFQRLSKSTIDVLQNFKNLSNNKIQIVVADPNGDDSTVFQTIVDYRMEGIPVTIDAGKKGTQQKMLFPWVLVENTQSNNAIPVFIQETNAPKLSRTILNKSEMLLEFNIANAIQQILKKERETVVFLTGNHQDLGYNYISAVSVAGSQYMIDTLNIKMASHIPEQVDVVIVSSPYEAFSEVEKYKLDQYMMRGGNVMFLLNQATGNLDSFRNGGNYNVLPVDLNLSDLLFHYGVRVNNNLLADATKSEMIPLSKSGKAEESVLMPWQYFPILECNNDHPITKNLDGVLARFASSIDVVEQDETIRKKILLSTSKYSKVIPLPAPLTLTEALIEPNIATYTKSNLPVAVLLEGVFSSFYAKRKPEEVQNLIQTHNLADVAKATKSGKILVVSDGDVIYNDLSPQGPLEMGQYKYGGYKYDNKSFFSNALIYLSNPNNLLEARGKTYVNRILDPQRVQQERTMWQMINIGLPSLVIIVFGLIWTFIRKRKYTH
jgi:ABC-2 type transport system permease protein